MRVCVCSLVKRRRGGPGLEPKSGSDEEFSQMEKDNEGENNLFLLWPS